MKPGTLQGGFNWYIGFNATHLALLRDGPPTGPVRKIKGPTRMLWGEGDPMMKVEWADRLADYFEDLNFDTVAEAGHFIHYERPDLANREIIVNGGAKLVHPGGAKLVHLTLCGTRCWGVVPAVHRRDPRCFV